MSWINKPLIKEGIDQFLDATLAEHNGFTGKRLREVLALPYTMRIKVGIIRNEADISSLNTVKSWIAQAKLDDSLLQKSPESGTTKSNI